MPAVVTATEPDAKLLAAFAAADDQAAFAELVRRHGPLVDGVCRRVLAPGPDADDAYQATFLVLARRAGELRNPEQLGPWLYGVAVRCARRARGAAARRKSRERPMFDVPADPRPDDWSEVRPLLDAEIDRLPEKLRSALVLCELQGVSRAKAAAQLGIPEGTLSSRVARAKDALRARLVRQGVTLTGVGLAVALGKASAGAAPLPAAVVPSAAALTIAQLETTMIAPPLLGKLALAFLTAALVGLTALLVGPPAPPGGTPPTAAAKGEDAERAKFVGTWRIRTAEVAGQKHVTDDKTPPPEQYNREWLTFAADGTFRDASNRPGTYTLDPAANPKRFTLAQTLPGGKGALTGVGIYEFDGDDLRACWAVTAGAKHPDKFASVGAAGDTRYLMVLRRDKPQFDEKAKFVGTWQFRTFLDADGKPAKYDFGGGGPATFHADGTTTQDDEISVLGFGDWAWTLDTAATPKRLKLAPIGNRPNRGRTREPFSMGYRFDGERLVLIQEKGMGTSDLVTQLEKSQDVDARRRAELKKLAGTWEIVSFELDGQKGGKLPGPQQMTLATDGTVTAGEQRGMVSIDPDAKPKRLTLAGLAPDAADPTRILVVKRIYELAGDTLRFANDQAGQEFPAGFAPPAKPAAMQHLVTTYRRALPPEDKEKAEREKFVGRWRPATLKGGDGLGFVSAIGLDATFRADGTLSARGFGSVGDGKWSLDAAAERLTLTTTPPGDPKAKPKAVTADYGFDGDRLTLKFFGKGDDSPYPDPKGDSKVPRLVIVSKLSDADARKLDAEEAKFVGGWLNFVPISDAKTEFRADGTFRSDASPDLAEGRWRLDVNANPPQITLDAGTPAARKSFSAEYRFDDHLTLSFDGTDANTPEALQPAGKRRSGARAGLILTKARDADAEKAKFVGRWQAVGKIGRTTAVELRADGTLVSTGWPELDGGRWKPDPAAKPPQITFDTPGPAPKSYAARYTLTDDSLQLSFDGTDAGTPKEALQLNGHLRQDGRVPVLLRRDEDAGAEKLKAERAKFAGPWEHVAREFDGKPAPPGPGQKAEKPALPGPWMTLTADGVADSGTFKGTYTLDPTQNPKQITMTMTWAFPTSDPAWTKPTVWPGIYEFAGDQLCVCYDTVNGKRPAKFASKDEAGNSFTLDLVRRPRPRVEPVDPAAAERAKFEGDWRCVEFLADGKPVGAESMKKLAGQPYRFSAATILMNADGTGGYDYSLYPGENPKQIDTINNRTEAADVGRKSEGIYKFEGNRLTLHMAGYSGTKGPLQPRPTDFVSRPGQRTTLTVYERVERPKPLALASNPLLGDWTVTAATVEGKPAAGAAKAAWVGKRVTVGDGTIALAHPATFKLYDKETPPQIDLVHTDGPAELKGVKVEGVYKLDGDTLTLHLADKWGAKRTPRPADFVGREGVPTTLLTLERVKK